MNKHIGTGVSDRVSKHVHLDVSVCINICIYIGGAHTIHIDTSCYRRNFITELGELIGNGNS